MFVTETVAALRGDNADMDFWRNYADLFTFQL